MKYLYPRRLPQDAFSLSLCKYLILPFPTMWLLLHDIVHYPLYLCCTICYHTIRLLIALCHLFAIHSLYHAVCMFTAFCMLLYCLYCTVLVLYRLHPVSILSPYCLLPHRILSTIVPSCLLTYRSYEENWHELATLGPARTRITKY